MEGLFFTSDTHFGCRKTLEMSRRPFATVEEMDNAMIERWNMIVKEDDVVYHLGDFGDYRRVSDLNGRVRLLLGNNDRNKTEHFDGFEQVYHEKNRFKQIDSVDLFVQMAHEPLNLVKSEAFDLFGHIHKLRMVRRNGLNVGMDCHNFAPLPIEEVLYYKDQIEHYCDENTFIP